MLDPFSGSYRVARERFGEAARAAAAPLERHVLPGHGPDGCDLAIDVALVGARNPRRAVVVSSGLHGVEGFFGCAVQLAWLRRFREGASPIPGGTLVVLLHAVNPFGFAWRRRANEDNVDLNRNFLADGETYGGVPEHYDRVHDLLNPATPPPRLDAFRLRAAWAVRRHGLSVLQNAVATGQYEHSSGLFFGGREAAASTRLVQDRFWSWTRAAEEVLHLDLHTGLGDYADYRLLVEPPHLHDLEWYRSLFDPERVAAVGGDTPYAARGVMGAWLARHAGPRRYRFACLEFGTYGPLRVLAALRAENRAHHHSVASAAAYGRAKRELVECFCPARGPWRRKAHARALEVIEQAVRTTT
ncbi:MAG: M14 family metallopeptidase [Acidobacteria bacterium]|nr:M14 family metallopeptidase [Acidobacteriota bacterium]